MCSINMSVWIIKKTSGFPPSGFPPAYCTNVFLLYHCLQNFEITFFISKLILLRQLPRGVE